jgi:hypothetical protein
MPIPTDPQARLRREHLAEALTEAGFPIKAKTLATKATRGGGPPFQRFGRIPLYPWGAAIAWDNRVYRRYCGRRVRETYHE